MANGVNENGVPTPTPTASSEGFHNGVRMPAPMSGGYEEGWNFNDDGYDMSGVHSFQGAIVGVQLPGGPNEEGWGYGQDLSNLAHSQEAPPTNQDFGLPSDNGHLMGTDAHGTHIVGRMAGNYDGVTAADILPVFGGLVPNGGQDASTPSGPVMGHDSMAGIPLAAGSGTYGAGEQASFSTGGSGIPGDFFGSRGGETSRDY